jgi:type I restriction enzyme M protein
MRELTPWLHFLHHLAPAGLAGFILANGSMSSQQSGEGKIRKSIVEGDLVDCMVALPGQLFYSTQIPVCLWFLSRDKKNGLGGRGKKMRNRKGETLFIDARKLGTMIDRVHRELTDADIERIADTYHRWRGDGAGTEARTLAGIRDALLPRLLSGELSAAQAEHAVEATA